MKKNIDTKRESVNNIARALRFHYDEQMAILFWVDKKWFDEQIENCEHYDEWFDTHAKGCSAMNMRNYDDPIHYYTYSLDGTGKALAKFLKEYAHVLCNVRLCDTL